MVATPGHGRETRRHAGTAARDAPALWALRERVKELTCLYGITQLSARTELNCADVLRGVLELLPQGWQHPERAVARIVVDDHAYATPGFAARIASQRADIVIAGKVRGSVEVAYTTEYPACDEGPFLVEERRLLDAVGSQLAGIVERREAAEERASLHEQELRHADRLATMGLLAAGVGHELNEPLANILGFAQLAAKAERLPAEVAADLDKVVAATLHAREIVKELMLFARQTPPATAQVDLNRVVEFGLDFLESRCAKQGITLERRLDPGLPPIVADPGQVQQVLVNLVVNAIQAMPEGGRLTIATAALQGSVRLEVRDTGVGMTDEVRQKIFLPFFTTKDVDQGTGLGLAVVHGIVTAHGGVVTVASEPGRGSSFVVTLPDSQQGEG